jgi:hypothetical protein
VTKGALLLRDQPPKHFVVLGDSFPQWLLHVVELGYEICHVLVKGPLYLRCFVAHWYPFGAEPTWVCWFLIGPQTLEISLALLTVGSQPNYTFRVLSLVGVEQVVSTQIPRRSCLGWHLTFIRVPHSEVGGVTTQIITLIGHSRNFLQEPDALELTVKGDAALFCLTQLLGIIFGLSPTNWWSSPCNVSTLALILPLIIMGMACCPAFWIASLQSFHPCAEVFRSRW